MTRPPASTSTDPPTGEATRGPARLASVTYAMIAGWTNLSLSTVRTYASRRAFDRRDIESILTWVNARRHAQNLPPIGAQPPEPPPPPPKEKGQQ